MPASHARLRFLRGLRRLRCRHGLEDVSVDDARVLEIGSNFERAPEMRIGLDVCALCIKQLAQVVMRGRVRGMRGDHLFIASPRPGQVAETLECNAEVQMAAGIARSDHDRLPV